MAVLIGFILRVIGVYVCKNKAEELNRSTLGWGIFGFLLPVIAMIWIHCMKPNMVWKEELPE